MLTLLAIFASSGSHPTLGLVIGFGMGLLLFVLGFRTYREYRILADTPVMPVRSIAMGLVHVRGKATGDDRLTSPLTKQPCFYYRVKVEEYVQKDKGNDWQEVGNDSASRNFYLDDGAAKVLVNPQNAQFEVLETFRHEIGPHMRATRYVAPSLGVAGPSDQDLRDYLSAAPGQISAALAAAHVPGAQAAGAVLGAMQKLENMGVSIGGGGVNVEVGGHTYRFTEHCLIAERDCNVLGSCAENPSPKDEHDRNLIERGQNEKTFLITTETETQIEKGLRKRSLLLILLGAVVMIGVAAIALHIAGML